MMMKLKHTGFILCMLFFGSNYAQQGTTYNFENETDSSSFSTPVNQGDTFLFYYNGVGYNSREESPIGEDEIRTDIPALQGAESGCDVSVINLTTGYIEEAPAGPIPNGEYDIDWLVVKDLSGVLATPRLASSINTHPAWTNSDPNVKRYISTFPNNLATATGGFHYKYNFCLNGIPNTDYYVKIDIKIRSDNQSEVFLVNNGNYVKIGGSSYDSFRGQIQTFTYEDQSSFVDGDNAIIVKNINSGSVTGLLIEGTVKTYTSVNSSQLVNKTTKGLCADACSPTGYIAGIVYDDLDDSGDLNHGDFFYNTAHTVNLYDPSNLTTPIATTTSGNKGFYLFKNIAPGNYHVEVLHLPNHYPQDPVVGSNGFPITTSPLNVLNGRVVVQNFDIAQVSTECLTTVSFQASDICVGRQIKLTGILEPDVADPSILGEHWEWMVNGSLIYSETTTGLTAPLATWSPTSVGTYVVSLVVTTNKGPSDVCKTITKSYSIEIKDCVPCEDCVPTFSPTPGEKYVLSAWVSEDFPDGKTDYINPIVDLTFEGSTTTFNDIKASGPIIDGWQRIEYVFTVPLDATSIRIELRADREDSYFDDVRIHPFNSSMKSYVFDQKTGRIMAEQNENNYSTFYEYDEEGNLTRIKQETEKGVKTIQESIRVLPKR